MSEPQFLVLVGLLLLIAASIERDDPRFNTLYGALSFVSLVSAAVWFLTDLIF